MFRAWGIGRHVVSAACASLILLLVLQATASSVGQVWHDVGLNHPVDPLAGAVLQHHAPDHVHSSTVRDPHSDWDGPPIVSDDSVDPAPHHHHYDNQTSLWILPSAAATPAPGFVAARWPGRSNRLTGVPDEGVYPPPRASFLQTA
jgi:hypothetical protein